MVKTTAHTTKDGDTLTDNEYVEYRRDYQAGWERDRYSSDEDYREYKKEKSKERYENMTPKEKKEYLKYLKEYREDKLNSMSKKEIREHKKDRSEYHKKRRDEKIVDDAKVTYLNLSETKKEKYLEKLFRYSRICNDDTISKELASWAVGRFDEDELDELGFEIANEGHLKFTWNKC